MELVWDGMWLMDGDHFVKTVESYHCWFDLFDRYNI